MVAGVATPRENHLPLRGNGKVTFLITQLLSDNSNLPR
jgi:hypothetical protein